MAATPGERRRQPTAQLQTKANSIRRLHVLATVEILQRLLTIELQPMERHVLPALALQPVCVLILDAPASPPHHCWVTQGAGTSAEGDFAKARLGLAPPLA
jgi:hypothetical protein